MRRRAAPRRLGPGASHAGRSRPSASPSSALPTASRRGSSRRTSERSGAVLVRGAGRSSAPPRLRRCLAKRASCSAASADCLRPICRSRGAICVGQPFHPPLDARHFAPRRRRARNGASAPNQEFTAPSEDPAPSLWRQLSAWPTATATLWCSASVAQDQSPNHYTAQPMTPTGSRRSIARRWRGSPPAVLECRRFHVLSGQRSRWTRFSPIARYVASAALVGRPRLSTRTSAFTFRSHRTRAEKVWSRSQTIIASSPIRLLTPGGGRVWGGYHGARHRTARSAEAAGRACRIRYLSLLLPRVRGTRHRQLRRPGERRVDDRSRIAGGQASAAGRPVRHFAAGGGRASKPRAGADAERLLAAAASASQLFHRDPVDETLGRSERIDQVSERSARTVARYFPLDRWHLPTRTARSRIWAALEMSWGLHRPARLLSASRRAQIDLAARYQ